MSNERKPLVSDSQCEFVGFDSLGPADAAETIRDHYERLITEGKLRVVEEVNYDDDKCSKCRTPIQIMSDCYFPDFCPGCGNPTKG